MLQSITGLELRAESLIRSWHYWREQQVTAATDTSNGPVTHLQLRALSSNATAFAETARSLIKDADFQKLAAKVQADIIAIAEEMESAIAEIDDHSHPDKAWLRLDKQKKLDITQHVHADNVVVNRLRSRMRGEMRAHKVEPPKK